MIITDEASNSLEWVKLPALALSKETEGYNILGTETRTDYYTESGEPAISAVCLYLSRSDDKRVKVIRIEAAADSFGEAQDVESPLEISVSYA